jgi:hypothetical protein
MKSKHKASNGIGIALLWLLVLSLFGCGPRVNIVTGTTVGLKVSPGDGNTRPPQITFAYKRAEVALIPTEGKKATKGSSGDASDGDAYSTLAAVYYETAWFGKTQIASFIATGHAARDIQEIDTSFSEAFAQTTLGVVPDAIQQRREDLMTAWMALKEDQARRILDLAGFPLKPGKTPKESLQDAIKDAQSDLLLVRLESAFQRGL